MTKVNSGQFLYEHITEIKPHPTEPYPQTPASGTHMRNNSPIIIKRNNLFRTSFEITSELENTKRHKMYGNQQLKPSAHAPSRPPFNK